MNPEHIYRPKPFWKASMMVVAIVLAISLVVGWTQGIEGGTVDPRVYLGTIVLTPLILYGLFLHPRYHVVLSDDGIEFHGLRGAYDPI
jgi:hypothetical protein